MVNLDWYRSLGHPDLTSETVRGTFLATLLGSNRPPDFFVDWKKVHRNVANHRDLLQKLAAIRGSAEAGSDLTRLLLTSPEVAPVLPMLIAWRTRDWKTLEEASDGTLRTISLDFSGTKRYTEEEAEALVTFCEKAGVTEVLRSTNDLSSFLLGVEAGMDTNARKNRSGDFMEAKVEPHMARAAAFNPQWRVFSQKRFSRLKEIGVRVPIGLLDRTFDYAVVGPPKPISIEVNFYEKEGSKPQEIVDSYIQRARELRESGWTFVWITDGPCWRGDTPQIRKAFTELDAVLNLELCRRGVLDAVLGVTDPAQLRELGNAVRSSTARKSIDSP